MRGRFLRINGGMIILGFYKPLVYLLLHTRYKSVIGGRSGGKVNIISFLSFRSWREAAQSAQKRGVAWLAPLRSVSHLEWVSEPTAGRSSRLATRDRDLWTEAGSRVYIAIFDVFNVCCELSRCLGRCPR